MIFWSGNSIFVLQPLANLEDEIFLKGVSICNTQKKFNQVFGIKILPGVLKFLHSGLFCGFQKENSSFYVNEFHLSQVELSKKNGLLCHLIKTISKSVDLYINLFHPELKSLKWLVWVLELFSYFNQLINLAKNSTKIWRHHVRSLNHFCAIRYLFHCILWVLCLIFFSGPVDSFALQPI